MDKHWCYWHAKRMMERQGVLYLILEEENGGTENTTHQ